MTCDGFDDPRGGRKTGSFVTTLLLVILLTATVRDETPGAVVRGIVQGVKEWVVVVARLSTAIGR